MSVEVPGVIGVHDIKIRKSGPFCFGEMHMEVEEGLPLEKAHAIAEEVEKKAKEECDELETLVIHARASKPHRPPSRKNVTPIPLKPLALSLSLSLRCQPKEGSTQQRTQQNSEESNIQAKALPWHTTTQ